MAFIAKITAWSGTIKALISCMHKPQAENRSAYRVLRPVTTRWSDNDAYGHVNNVVYYSWFDTAVNAYLIEQGALDIHNGETIGLVVETHCNYFSPLAFPEPITVGLRVEKMGTSSVRYGLAIFGKSELAAAQGYFVHVYVNAATRVPTALPDKLITVLESLL
jgi:acyl-CoA thioester hydrolase